MNAPAPSQRRALPRWIYLLMVPALLFISLILLALLTEPDATQGTRSVVLPDGSRFELKETAITKGSYNYQYQSGPRWVKPLAPVIPDFLERRIPGRSGGGFGFGSEHTNLILITVLEEAAPQSAFRPRRVRIHDAQGNAFDAVWGAHTLAMNRVVVNGWQAPAFPRRSPTLTAQFLGKDSQQKWVEIASFTIRNPLDSDFEGEEWTPEPLPVSKSDGDLAIQLKQFQSGSSASGEDPLNSLSPRLTQMEFEFSEDGQPTEHFRVQKVTLADATGNEWHPYLNLLKDSGNNYSKGGYVQFVGALWPGEPAWKVEVEAFRTAGFDPDTLWDVGRLALPRSGQHLELTNAISIGETPLQVANFLAPGVQVTNEWQWILRYWGNEPSIYPMGLHAPGGLKGHRIVVVEARDENGDPLELIEQRGWDNERQALFFKIPAGSQSLQLQLAVPEIKRARFLAKPEFVENRVGDND